MAIFKKCFFLCFSPRICNWTKTTWPCVLLDREREVQHQGRDLNSGWNQKKVKNSWKQILLIFESWEKCLALKLWEEVGGRAKFKDHLIYFLKNLCFWISAFDIGFGLSNLGIRGFFYLCKSHIERTIFGIRSWKTSKQHQIQKKCVLELIILCI